MNVSMQSHWQAVNKTWTMLSLLKRCELIHCLKDQIGPFSSKLQGNNVLSDCGDECNVPIVGNKIRSLYDHNALWAR